MKIFIIEDNIYRLNWFCKQFIDCEIEIVTTSKEGITLFESGYIPDVAFFDHDLGGEEMLDSSDPDTSIVLAQYLKEKEKKINRIIIHSLNPAGSTNLFNILHSVAGGNIAQIPFNILISSKIST